MTGSTVHAQIDGVVETVVTYQKPATRKLPPDAKTYDVRSHSNFSLSPFGMSEGEISAKLALNGLQRVPENGDLHLVVTVGTAQGPQSLHPKMVNTGDYIMSIEAPIYAPLYYKLTDAKGMVYEEDSALSSSYQTFSVAFRSRTNVEPAVSSYTNNTLLQTHTRSAIETNIDWINFLLNEQFFGGTKKVNMHFFYLNKSAKFGLDGMDKQQADSIVLALNQFSRDQQWPPLEQRAQQAAAYWEVELSHLDQLTPSLKNHNDRYDMLFLKYDLYYNLALAYIWLKDGRRVDYYLDRCRLLKEREGFTADAEGNYQDIFPAR
ncbi:hypothetical protein DCM91_04020 [Chitinophaga costaii]|nr:hypothetical protein DCM91_04020 [Chitinophaga costaii]